MTVEEKRVIKQMFKRWGSQIREGFSTFISWAFPILNVLMFITCIIGICGVDAEDNRVALWMTCIPLVYATILLFATHGDEIIEDFKAEWRGERYYEYDSDEDDDIE